MNTQSQLNRPMKFALMSAGAAGFISFLMIATFIDMLTFLFVPCVMIMVFVSAYFAFKRQMRNKGMLTGKRIFSIAFEVGTVTHFYTFALYLPIIYVANGPSSIEPEILGTYLLYTVIGGISSIVAFVWIAVPMYIGVGYILKSMEGEHYPKSKILDESLLDDPLAVD